MKKWKCVVCGYIHTGEEPPEKCPVCAADKSMFIEIVDEGVKKDDQPAAVGQDYPAASSGKWKCVACGYLYEGNEPPEKCPVCGAEKTMFVERIEGTPEEQRADARVATVKQPMPETEKASGFVAAIGNLVMRHHLHPIAVHTPNGVIPVAVIFIILAMGTGFKALEMAAFFNMIFVLLTMPAVIATGYIAWQKKYKGVKTYVFIVKIICSFLIAVVLTVMICWRIVDGEIAFSQGTGAWIYLALGALLLAAAGIAGHLGGKLVFHSSK